MAIRLILQEGDDGNDDEDKKDKTDTETYQQIQQLAREGIPDAQLWKYSPKYPLSPRSASNLGRSAVHV